MHAERDTVLPIAILSVCPTNPGIVSKRMDTGLLSQFFDAVFGCQFIFLRPNDVTKFPW